MVYGKLLGVAGARKGASNAYSQRRYAGAIAVVKRGELFYCAHIYCSKHM